VAFNTRFFFILFDRFLFLSIPISKNCDSLPLSFQNKGNTTYIWKLGCEGDTTLDNKNSLIHGGGIIMFQF
jgi:hypothetical protein